MALAWLRSFLAARENWRHQPAKPSSWHAMGQFDKDNVCWFTSLALLRGLFSCSIIKRIHNFFLKLFSVSTIQT